MAIKRLRLDFTNIDPNLEKIDILDIICLSKGNIYNSDKYWININVEEGSTLLKRIIECRGRETILLLMHKDIVVRELLKSRPRHDIVQLLRKCLIIDHEMYNEKFFIVKNE